jgi:multiple sugar transport system substrate-binding protein
MTLGALKFVVANWASRPYNFGMQRKWMRGYTWNLLVVLLGSGVLLTGCWNSEEVPSVESGPITLVYRSVFERQEDIQPLIDEYMAQNEDVSIQFEQRNIRNYRDILEVALRSNNGPDIFRFHNSWVPSLRPYLAETTTKVSSELQYSQTFYPVVLDDLTSEGGYLGIPLMYDGLTLFYNKQLFREAGLIEPPRSWDEILGPRGIAKRFDVGGSPPIKGIAMGSTENVDHWEDIFALLALQAGADLGEPLASRASLESARSFFKQAIGEGVWSSTMPESTEAFGQGRLAMYFGVSWRAFEIQEIDPQLQFESVPVPQLPGSTVGYANYWVEGVSNSLSEREQAAAWEFLSYLASRDVAVKRYGLQDSKRLFGEPFARVDLRQNISQNQYLGGIVASAPEARSWYLNGQVFGGGFNLEIANAYKQYINEGLSIDGLDAQVKQILRGAGAQ